MYTNHGVVLTLETVVFLLNTQTVAVPVAAALGTTVVAHIAKVALAQVRLHTRAVGLTALAAHWLALPATVTHNTCTFHNGELVFSLQIKPDDRQREQQGEISRDSLVTYFLYSLFCLLLKPKLTI